MSKRAASAAAPLGQSDASVAALREVFDGKLEEYLTQAEGKRGGKSNCKLMREKEYEDVLSFLKEKKRAEASDDELSKEQEQLARCASPELLCETLTLSFLGMPVGSLLTFHCR